MSKHFKVGGPYEISETDVRVHHLDPKDEGKWALIINGTFSIYKTKEEARKAKREIETGNP